jgi:hypothetical protein
MVNTINDPDVSLRSDGDDEEKVNASRQRKVGANRFDQSILVNNHRRKSRNRCNERRGKSQIADPETINEPTTMHLNSFFRNILTNQTEFYPDNTTHTTGV